ncbi:hypothetical protein [Methylocystis parvus]|uniref:Uncharacterized protein n=1 Tax=Methylocystis parvus TaxID=134 RepID=A0A6B8M9G4_9HYPH|nr:hypothetical protein [Methylocystis parvus]QGM98462.1 hypothetical protein F7D14_13920 [Methylocystis parvus]WBK01199.1 hypothetical protein MMG94_05645 [Methylocystis parvus OBBP]
MPRLGLSFNNSFDSRPRAPKADAYGRRPRQVTGVQIVGERETSPIFSSVYVKAMGLLAIVAAISVAAAIIRIYAFRH